MSKKIEKRPVRRSTADIADFRSWLSGLGLSTAPSVHINAHSSGFYMPAVMTVDFGQALRQPKLSPDTVSELIARIRRATKDVLGRDATIRVHTDNQRGVYWASAA